MDRLKDKIALVTGGTTGIGLAAARLFAAEGARVTVTGQSPKSLEVAAKELRGVAEVVASDASKGEDVKRLAATFAERGVDVLFLNAGIAKLGPIASLDEADFDATYRVNVLGPWLTIKYFAPLLRDGGAVVVNTSVNNQLGMAGSSVYAASKAALRSIVRTAAGELAPRGIRVNAVSPGPVETPLYGKLGLPEASLRAFSETLVAQVPLHRFGRPDEIAKAALFLASDDASYMTGEEIVVDGGFTRV